uniref:Odorant binding protein 3 n=1 Tax=Xylotrechus quadripes TaxID=554073 RepID=A0A346HGM5_9CUCU|nr:odorant binding protein 3 [Xylotrechus quadripes]
MLKFVVFMSVCVALSRGMSDEMKELMDSLHKTCTASTGATEDVVAKAQKGDFTEDENLKCYMKCTLDEVGLVEDDGKIDIEGMIAMLPDEVKDTLDPILRKCGATSVGANACETVFLLYKCTFNENPSMYFLP